jgi:uncharacterized protein (TIGR02217 family)
MTDSVFPSLPGLSWNLIRTPTWQTRTQVAVSGRETRQADWSYPRYSWSLDIEMLRSTGSFTELQTLIGFYNQMQGGFGTFLYSDDDDNAAVNQQLGTGDGSTVTFPLIRTFGNYIEPISRVNTVSSVTVSGSAASYTVNYDAGVESGSSITFASAPAASAPIVASFTFYWRCRFSDDTVDFTKFLYGMSSVSALKFESVK